MFRFRLGLELGQVLDLGIEVEFGLGWIVVRFGLAKLGLGLGSGLEFDFGLVWLG